MLMQLSCGCCDGPVTPITLKAFGDDGAFLWEYWMARVYESHDGTLYGLEAREITPAWEAFEQIIPNYGFSSSSFAQPVKSGTRPLNASSLTLGTCKQYALDAILIDRATGTRTLLHSNIDYKFAEYDSTSVTDMFLKLGIPDFAPAGSTLLSQAYEVTDDGSCCLQNPLIHSGILFFDQWKQSVTSRYRICAAWHYPDGTPSQWTWTNGASSATFATTATAATIETALETITGVVSATVTGGPLPLFHVDIEVEWTTNTGRFTSIAVQRVNKTGRAAYSFSDGKIAGRATFTQLAGSRDIITSDNTGVVTGNATRHLITSDSNGLLIGTGTVWSVTAINATRTPFCAGMTIVPGVVRAAFGRVLVRVTRSTRFGTTLTHAVLNEATGGNIGNTDAVMDYTEPLFVDASDVAIWGVDDCGLRTTGGEQFLIIPATGSGGSTSCMIQGFMIGCDGANAFLVNEEIVGNASDNTAYSDFAGLLDETLTTTVSDTVVTGGDAFFPTTSYVRKRVYFSSPPQLWNSTTEWRIVLLNGATVVKQTAWMVYSDGDTEVDAELALWYGNNSAALPCIQLPFSSTDNSITPLMWFQRSGAELLITASNNAPDIAAHNLVPSTYTYRIELRDANVRFQRALCAVQVSDSTVLWQRNIGEHLTTILTSGNYRVTSDHGVVVAFTTVPRKSSTHPAIVTGPLP